MGPIVPPEGRPKPGDLPPGPDPYDQPLWDVVWRQVRRSTRLQEQQGQQRHYVMNQDSLFYQLGLRLCLISGLPAAPEQVFVRPVVMTLLTDPCSLQALRDRQAMRAMLTPVAFAEMERCWLDIWYSTRWRIGPAIVPAATLLLRAEVEARWAEADAASGDQIEACGK